MSSRCSHTAVRKSCVFLSPFLVGCGRQSSQGFWFKARTLLVYCAPVWVGGADKGKWAGGGAGAGAGAGGGAGERERRTEGGREKRHLFRWIYTRQEGTPVFYRLLLSAEGRRYCAVWISTRGFTCFDFFPEFLKRKVLLNGRFPRTGQHPDKFTAGKFTFGEHGNGCILH